MKHLFRNIVVFFFSITGVAFMYRHWHLRKGPLVRVISFHDVMDEDWFSQVISALVKKYHILSPDAFHNGEYRKDKINILITFDDGYESWVRVCAPVLHQHGIQALFFINSGFLDAAYTPHLSEAYVRENLKVSPKVPLTWDGARSLVAMGHAIGGHTVHHQNLRQISLEQVEGEVADDKEKIERQLNIAIVDFAYPFGVSKDYSEPIEKIVRSQGYTHVYIAEPGFVHSSEKHIPRTLIEKNQSLSSICSWLLGGYDIFVQCRKRMRS